MSRLSAIALLCLALFIPSLAAGDEEAPAEGQSRPEAAAPDTPPTAITGLEDLPPEVLEKLGPEEIVEILQTLQDAAIEAVEIESGSFDLVPIVVPVAFFLTVLLGLVSTLVLRYRKHAQLQETLRLMIEKGADIPPELITPPVPQFGDLRRGVILVGAGLSLLILVGLVDGFDTGSWAVGLIPAFIGAGYLLVWRLSKRAESS